MLHYCRNRASLKADLSRHSHVSSTQTNWPVIRTYALLIVSSRSRCSSTQQPGLMISCRVNPRHTARRIYLDTEAYTKSPRKICTADGTEFSCQHSLGEGVAIDTLTFPEFLICREIRHTKDATPNKNILYGEVLSMGFLSPSRDMYSEIWYRVQCVSQATKNIVRHTGRYFLMSCENKMNFSPKCH